MSTFAYKDETYTVIETIKSDSYFSYYKCQNTLSKNLVIIEKINKPMLKAELNKLPINDIDELFNGYIDAYKREINLLKETDNLNILKGIDFIEEQNQIILIKEFANMNLKDYIKNIKKKGLTSPEIRYIFTQLNRAIEYFREQNHIHTCISYENVFLQFDERGQVTDDFKVKIADFGILSTFEVNAKFQLNTKRKIPFMAPELFISVIDDKSDLYSLGILLYFLRFNELPTENELYKTYGFLQDPQDPLLKDLLNKLILKEPNKRMNWNEYFKHPFFEIKEEERIQFEQKKIKKRKTIIKTNMVFPSKELCNEETNENKKMEVDNERNGNMSVIFENGDKYTGDFVHNIKEGKGYMLYSNGDKYEGQFSKDKKEGFGIMLYCNGERYEGEFKDDEKNGYGIYQYLDGEIYKGDFKNGNMEGRGIFLYPNGEYYSGDFKNNKKDGYGIYFEKNGNKYLGEYKNDLKNGKGLYIYDNENGKEECFFIDDRQIKKDESVLYNTANKNETPQGIVPPDENVERTFTGKKIKYYEDGVYEGDFENGLKSGIGTYIYKNGDKYIGGFKNDEKNGYGAYYYNNGDSYLGEFSKNKKDGKGSYYYTNGDKFTGKFKKGKAHGFGKFYYMLENLKKE